jgi:hypothetical protein
MCQIVMSLLRNIKAGSVGHRTSTAAARTRNEEDSASVQTYITRATVCIL